MAVKGHRVTVTAAATRLTSAANKVGEKKAAYFRNRGSASVDIGGSDVTSGTGYELLAGEGVGFDLLGRDDPYAIAASGTVRVDVFEAS